ncbi:beta-ketoacyl synthase N-terminal-like domain-containing protein [Mesonia maritima]|uniref:3-oxoacyl-(Acyl-carrier-protein) synthase n=2 Tax=Mesonia maritima TaxID=1793873 RepID=A0ABU1K3H8_9FLAO|nr:beta-ketoacyl synthase N-terminal-like domain-containing protein [Mesonia maritima]MDR6299562.1 3-oxoacyl-(acyl-carrier-protein) synthase [Mesonia maritima]
MSINPISIVSHASISALGSSEEVVWNNYVKGKPLFKKIPFQHEEVYVSKLANEEEEKIEALKIENQKYSQLDRSVLNAIFSGRKAVKNADWEKETIGVNIGSSRGATQLFEKYYQEFLTTEKSSTLASPTTTLGNISSWVMQDLGIDGVALSHSITCSTAFHGILNAIAWLESGMSDKFLVGGSEAPLTPFTIAQMKALKLYAPTDENSFPNKSMDFSKARNTMILGEAAASFCLEKAEKNEKGIKIIGYGFGSEKLKHSVSISSDAECLQTSMKMALNKANLEMVDAVVLHAPGTIKGDTSELAALQKIFPKELPALTSNKFLIGHTFGASGAMSLEMAILMLKNQQFIENPFYKNKSIPPTLKSIMVNAVGFGGNAVSIIISINS